MSRRREERKQDGGGEEQEGEGTVKKKILNLKYFTKAQGDAMSADCVHWYAACSLRSSRILGPAK